MKFKYDISKNYFSIFNQSQGIVTFRKEIEKDVSKVDTYLNKCKSYLFLVFVLLVVALLFNFIDNTWLISELLLSLFAICAALVTILVAVFIFSYIGQSKLFHSGEIQFSKTGILDISDSGVKIGIDWNLVDLVVMTDSIIVILTKTNFYFHFDETLIDDILSAINKYHKDVKIIDASVTRHREKLLKELDEQETKIEEIVEEKKIEEKANKVISKKKATSKSKKESTSE